MLLLALFLNEILNFLGHLLELDFDLLHEFLFRFDASERLFHKVEHTEMSFSMIIIMLMTMTFMIMFLLMRVIMAMSIIVTMLLLLNFTNHLNNFDPERCKVLLFMIIFIVIKLALDRLVFVQIVNHVYLFEHFLVFIQRFYIVEHKKVRKSAQGVGD